MNTEHYPSVYGIGKWTNSYRAQIRHINHNGKPLCGGKRQKRVFTWQPDTEQPDCPACLRAEKKDIAFSEVVA